MPQKMVYHLKAGLRFVVASSLCLAHNNAIGQNVFEEANYGSVELSGGFLPDPYTVEITAGGMVEAASIDGCIGYISDAPDFELDYTDSSDYTLEFYVVSNSDTTLVINSPSGQWHCNDDFEDAGGTNPGIIFANPENGIYDIWIGTYEENSFEEAELVITEIGPPWEETSYTAPESNAATEPALVSSGTGFLVSRNGHVLTNHHVIEGCAEINFQLRGQVPQQATLISSNSNTDLALLQTPLISAPAVFRASSRLRLGDEVIVYGFPLLGDLSSQGNLTNGIVSALSGLDDDLSRLQMTAQIQPGNSGGPVMNRSGEIVGVVVETANQDFFREQRGTDTQNLNFAIRDSLAISFLETNNVDYQMGSGEPESLSIADIAETAQEFTGLIRCFR